MAWVRPAAEPDSPQERPAAGSTGTPTRDLMRHRFLPPEPWWSDQTGLPRPLQAAVDERCHGLGGRCAHGVPASVDHYREAVAAREAWFQQRPSDSTGSAG
jgi:hypothetical protein